MKNHGIKQGLIMAAVFVIYSMVVYFINPRLLFNASLSTIISILIPAYFMYKASVDTRTDQGGLISFGEALKPAFIAYAVGTLVYIFFTYILYNFIDPSLLDIQAEVAAEMGESIMNMMGQGDNEEAKNAMQEAMDEQASQFSIGTAIMGWVFGLVFGLIISLIVAAIAKRSGNA